MVDLLTDLRFGLRTLRRRPATTAVAVLSLALAIGAATTVYALFDAILLDPLPVAAPERLVRLYAGTPQDPWGNWIYPDFVDAAAAAGASWERFAASAPWQFSLETGDQSSARLIEGALVSTSYFETLGVGLVHGRGFTPSPPAAAAHEDAAEAVLGYGLWQRGFGGDPGVVGRSVRLGGHRFEIVGVAPRGFRGFRLDEPSELWVPLGNFDALATGFYTMFDAVAYPVAKSGNRISMWDVVARLGAEVRPEQATAELGAMAAQVAERAGTAEAAVGFALEPLRAGVLDSRKRTDGRRFLGMLGAAVAALFAVACLNVANLLVARGVERRGEIGLRMALGCRPRRIVRQLLTESLIVAFIACGLGLLIASWGLELLAAYRLPGDVTVASLDLTLAPRVVAAGLVAGLAACLGFGLLPAIGAARRGPRQALDGRGAERSSDRGRGVLVAAQVGLSILLLVGAGLFLRSVDNALATDLGFAPEHVTMLTVDPSMARFDAARTVHLTSELQARARALPGARSAALTSTPFGEKPFSIAGISVEGRAFDPDARIAEAWVSPGYFEVMGIDRLTGRDFAASDSETAPQVAVINRTMAERLWPGEPPVGKRFHFSDIADRPFIEVVGVVADSHYWSLRRQGEWFVYLPLEQQSLTYERGAVSLLVRRTGAAAGGELRAMVAEVAPELPVAAVATLEERVAALMMPERLGRAVLSSFAFVALLIAAGGIAAVVAHGVARRRREIGIRLALGAGAGSVVGLFVRRALVPAAWGMAGGLVLAAALTHVLDAFLYDVDPLDPLTFAGSAALFLAVALAASLLPARNAARVDPMEALRAE